MTKKFPLMLSLSKHAIAFFSNLLGTPTESGRR